MIMIISITIIILIIVITIICMCCASLFFGGRLVTQGHQGFWKLYSFASLFRRTCHGDPTFQKRPLSPEPVSLQHGRGTNPEP